MLITRTRLLDRLRDITGLVVVSAGAGYGKSILLQQIARTEPEAVVVLARSGHGAPALRANESPRDLLLVDDIEYLDTSSARSIVALGKQGRIVVASRLPHAGLDLRSGLELGIEDLAFDRDEIAELLVHAGLDADLLGAPLHTMTGGWPKATADIIQRLKGASNPSLELGELARRQDALAPYLSDPLASLDESDQRALVKLADLGAFDEKTGELLGGEGFVKRLSAAGVPLVHRGDGWSSLQDRVRSHILREPANEPVASEILSHLVARGAVMTAVHACLGRGEWERAAELIAGLTLDDESRVDVTELNAAMGAIGSVAERVPRSLTVQAHVNAINGQTDEGFAAIDRSVNAFAAMDPECNSRGHIEALLFLAMFRTFESRWDEVERLIEICEVRVDLARRDQLVAHLFDLKSLYANSRFGDAQLEAALQYGQEALAIWRGLGEARAATVSTFRLATVLQTAGRWSDALAVLDALPALGPMSMTIQARHAVERAWLLPFLGRADEVPALVADARRIAQLLGIEWIAGYADVIEVLAASVHDDDARVAALASRFISSRPMIQDRVTTAIYEGVVAHTLARVGLYEDAATLIKRIQAVEGTPTWMVEYYAADLEARVGEPAKALEVLASIQARPDVERGAHWAVPLSCAIAHDRAGDRDAALQRLAEARELAAALGEPELPDIFDWRALRALEGATTAVGPPPSSSNASWSVGTADEVEVVVYNDFAVSIDGVVQDLGTRKGALLLKHLAVNSGRLHVDQVVDALWPDADAKLGRRRLRNVLARVREFNADLVQRSGDMIQFGPVTRCDYLDARESAQLALASDQNEADVQAAIQALDRPLLPEERYDDWAELARSEQMALLVRLLDVQAALAEAKGDRAQMLAALQRAESLDIMPSRRSAVIESLMDEL